MVLMAGFELPVKAIREQVASALNIIMHVERMPDGRRVVTSLTEVQGMEGDIILLQEIFAYRVLPQVGAKPAGELAATGLRPKFLDKLALAGIDVPARAFQTAAMPGPGRATRSGRLPTVTELAGAERSQ
jgi:pilus assembly protein CpaF